MQPDELPDLSWSVTGNGAYAHGRESTYLVLPAMDGGARLTWWRRPATALPHEVLLAARGALANAVIIPAGRAYGATTRARALAQRYEDSRNTNHER